MNFRAIYTGSPFFLIKFVFVLLLREGLSGKGVRLYAQVFVLDIVGCHVYGFSVAEGKIGRAHV